MDKQLIGTRLIGWFIIIVLPGWAAAQDLGESFEVGGVNESVDVSVRAAPMLKGALSSPIDSAAIYNRLNSLKGDSTIVTRGAREAQIYSSLSPAVVLILTNDGLGSGSLIDLKGTILTNWHVVEGYGSVGVVFKPKSEGAPASFDSAIIADVIRIDEVADLALLRLRDLPKGVNPIPLGTMDEVVIGADVHAIGHPTGESWTYTRGFVSQIRKDYEWAYDVDLDHVANVVQTQTPINPGNSGGPLLSSSGHLIGVNSFKAEGEALNFAVSVDEVRRFLDMKSDRLATRNRPPTAEPSANCGDEPEHTYRGDDGVSTVSLFDFDCDGEIDASYTEPDDPNLPAYLSMDRSQDGNIDTMFIDSDRDGDIDYSLFDVSGDGKPDLKGHYRNGEDEPYRMEKLT